jgi:hypothetical protein
LFKTQTVAKYWSIANVDGILLEVFRRSAIYYLVELVSQGFLSFPSLFPSSGGSYGFEGASFHLVPFQSVQDYDFTILISVRAER